MSRPPLQRLRLPLRKPRPKGGIFADDGRYRQLFAVSLDAILFCDEAGRCIEANTSAALLFGLPHEQLVAMHAGELRLDGGPETEAQWRDYLAVGRGMGEFPFRGADGGLHIAQYTAARLGPDLHMVLLRDITIEREAGTRLRTSLAEKDVLLKELHHRVKNNLQVIASMLRLQSEQIADLYMRELFLESQRRVRAMALVHERLYQAPDLACIDLAAYVRTLVTDLLRAYRVVAPGVTINTDISVAGVNVDQAMALGLILNELIANCLKHAFPHGRTGSITISASRGHQLALILMVSDDGVGMPDEIDPLKSPSMGLQIVHALATQLGGCLAWRRSPGTAVTLIIPERFVEA